jgi:glycosyltransferase involved in cell wall biosynthesis
MATYNRAHFIEETLLSIQKQTFTDWECLIIDDGSTDNTFEIINKFNQRDIRIKLYSRPNSRSKGPSTCRNIGIEKSKGEYIIFFDDDDIPHPQNLEICVYELSKRNISFCRYIRDVFVYDFDYIFDYSKSYTSFYIDKGDVEKMLKQELFFVTSSVMWRADCFEKNRFAETLMYCEDLELYSRIVSSGYSGISISKTLFFGRKHPNSLTGDFYRNDPIKRESFTEAILLVLKSLKEKQLLTYSLKRYFIATAIDFKEYNLFKRILSILELPTFEKIKWQIFYTILPLRLTLYRMNKSIKKSN